MRDLSHMTHKSKEDETPYGKRLIVQTADDLARDEPDRIYATISRSNADLADGFRDVTIKEFVNAVNAAAWWIEGLIGRSDNFEVVAYMGQSDIRYAIIFFALVKCGYVFMIPSVRNSESQQLAVLDEAQCTKFLCTLEMEDKVAALKRQRPSLRFWTVAPLDDMLKTKTTHYPYKRTWPEASTDPLIIAHSSGSTGNPKPSTITNGVYSVYDNHRNIPKIPGRKNQDYTLCDFEGGGKLYNPFPPFHLAGLFAMTSMAIFYNSTVTMGPPDKPPSGQLVSQAMKMIKIRAAWCPPTVIEQLLQEPDGFDQAASLDWIMYTGGPLAPSAGDRLSKVTDVCQMYGSTETGPHVTLVPLRKNWQWFEWHPYLENDMESMGDGSFEMVVYKDPALTPFRHLAHTNPDLEVWRTNDLFIQNPENPKLWRFQGRRDDVIVLSNGEKFNPVTMEGIMLENPLLRGALITGTARFQASLLVEPNPGLTMSHEELIDAIWPTVQKANSKGPGHGRIFRSKIVVAVPEKPFLRAGKGTVIRKMTTNLYKEELDAVYQEASEQLKIEPKNVGEHVRKCVATLGSFSEKEDLFMQGLDSLQTMELTKLINGGLPNKISSATIYEHPTVESLVQYLTGNSGQDVIKNDRIGRMRTMVEKYSDFSQYGLSVILTGSTGSLGTNILQVLIDDPKVAKIHCLNRSNNAHERHATAFSARRVSYDLRKVHFHQADFSSPDFGLPSQTFEELKRSVDVIIHNAWKVNFNHSLESFEDQIRGVRNFADWALSSIRKPHIHFISSLSSIGNWGNTQPIPEVPMQDYNVALEMGYGESKHVAERILNAAVEKGLCANVLRVGQIAGPLASNGGEWNRAEWLPTLVQSSKVLGYIPGNLTIVDWIPVDELSRIVVDLVHSTWQTGRSRTYHLVNPRPRNWADLVQTITKCWDGMKVVGFAEWAEMLVGDPKILPAVKIRDFYIAQAKESRLPWDLIQKYDISHTLEDSATMACLAPVDIKAIETWLQQWDF